MLPSLDPERVRNREQTNIPLFGAIRSRSFQIIRIHRKKKSCFTASIVESRVGRGQSPVSSSRDLFAFRNRFPVHRPRGGIIVLSPGINIIIILLLRGEEGHPADGAIPREGEQFPLEVYHLLASYRRRRRRRRRHPFPAVVTLCVCILRAFAVFRVRLCSLPALVKSRSLTPAVIRGIHGILTGFDCVPLRWVGLGWAPWVS